MEQQKSQEQQDAADQQEEQPYQQPSLNIPQISHQQPSPARTMGHVAAISSSRLESDPGYSLNSVPVSYGLAMHLIDLFFEKVQPWLPIIHKPRFLKHCIATLQCRSDCLAGVDSPGCQLFLGLFALSARYSSRDRFANLPPSERGREFADQAQQLQKLCEMHEPSVQTLQGAILLAFYI
jgi:hypothetical protein